VFDLRYHVASLAAVFFALVIGILVGVALASHGLGNTERNRLQEDLRRAENRGDTLKAQLDARVESGTADKTFVDRTYQVVMANRLKGAKVAVLFVGSVDGDQRSAITRALTDANAGAPLRIRSVKVPVDDVKVDKRLANRPFLAAYAGPSQLEELGHALGQEFAAGAETPLWNALKSLIVEYTVGPSKRPADGVVVVRTASPQMGATARFLKGLYSGIGDAGVPAIGVEATDAGESAMKTFQKSGLSTVDDIDTRVGKLTLVVLLSEPAVTGDFGTKPSAHDGPLPKIILPPTTTTGG
jgi:Copper transport outer membrane protein, MctB